MISIRSTKTELVAHLAMLGQQLQAQRHTIKALREDLCMAQNQPLLPRGKATHTSYYDYVRQCRMEAKQRGQRVVTYKTFAQWSAA